MKHIVLALFAVLLVTSCLSIHEHVDLKSNGSGKLVIRYELSEEAAGFGRLAEDEQAFPIPIEKDQFKDGAEMISGITFKSYSSKLRDGVHHVSGTVTFDNVEALSAFMFGHGGRVTFDSTGEESSLSFIFETRGVVEMSKDAEDMVREFFGTESVSLSVRVPGSVTSVSRGSFDGRNAETSLTVPDLVAENSFSWTVSWR